MQQLSAAFASQVGKAMQTCWLARSTVLGGTQNWNVIITEYCPYVDENLKYLKGKKKYPKTDRFAVILSLSPISLSS